MKSTRFIYVLFLTVFLLSLIACDLDIKENSQAIAFFEANKLQAAPNGSVTLSWKATGADKTYIDNGIGVVTKEGSKEIILGESGSYTYTLTAVTNGKRETASVTITVQDSLAANTTQIIDHTCTDPSLIPVEALDLAKTRMLFQYLRYGPHGDQILIGLDELEAENPLFVSAYSECHFPSEYPALRIMNGIWGISGLGPCMSFISPEDFWQNTYMLYWFLVNAITHRNPHINASIWMWEGDLNGYSHLFLSQFISIYEQMYEFVGWLIPMIFGSLPTEIVLSTGPADTPSAVRAERNGELRKLCNRFGFLWMLDIEDIESWYNGEQYLVDGIPTRHPHYADDGSGGGTNADLRRAKAVAFWWLAARLSGWDGN